MIVAALKKPKNVPLVTDDTDTVQSMAEKIEKALTGCRVDGIQARDFFGCEKLHPPSFEYLENVLKHIDLAGRVCFGIQ
jgi:hypothetical protein